MRLPLLTDDGAVVLMEYRGIVHATAAFERAVAQDTATEWDDPYMRRALTFDPTSDRYEWLLQSLVVARGRLRGAKDLEYEVFRLA